MESHDVIVVGAGMAGLTAAQQLVHRGFDVLVLEAQSYNGGRVKTFHDWGLPIELGAEFVHGDQTVTAQLARELGLEVVVTHEDRKIVDAEGQALSHDRKQIYYQLVEYVTANGKVGVSVGEIISQNPLTQDPELCALVANLIGDYEAGDADKLDSGAYTEMVQRTARNGANHLLHDGYQQLVANLSEGLVIRHDTVVSSIAQSTAPGVRLTTKAGEIFEAKAAVVTVSLGVLQSGDIRFEPRLSAQKTKAIQMLGMGNAIKFIVRLKDPHDVIALYHYADSDNATLQTITCWWASGSDPRVLVGYCGGSRATSVLGLSEERLLEKVMHDLSTLVGRDLRGQLIDHLLVRWDTNPFIRGSYSNHPVGVTSHDRAALAEPEGRIFWAGEATQADGNYATVHGAIMSGYRAADEISAHLQLTTPFD